jgi:hypothetical protein
MVAPGITGHTRPTKVKKQVNKEKRKRDDVDVEKLESAVQDLVRSIEPGVMRILFSVYIHYDMPLDTSRLLL